MSKEILFDEFRLSVLVPADLEDSGCQAIQKTLESQPFRAALRRAVRQLVRQYPDLDPVQVRITV